MYTGFQLAIKYIRYYKSAANAKGHGIHSPFVFRFILHVLNNRSGFNPPDSVEALRKQLLQDKRLLQIEDFGAGSRVSGSKRRTVSEVAFAALKSKKYAHLLFRLVSYFKPQTVLELGTSLGITTAYLAMANSETTVATIEGSKAIAGIAGENFSLLRLANIQQHCGNFDDILPSLLQKLPTIDLGYVDGNHRYAPTIAYFHQLLSAVGNDSVLVFDDIHWSAEMEKAWEEIKQHPSVKCTIDIFFLGFVFFRSEFKEKQHFTIRF
jgi:predicted O-methyltransferase YrrM